MTIGSARKSRRATMSLRKTCRLCVRGMRSMEARQLSSSAWNTVPGGTVKSDGVSESNQSRRDTNDPGGGQDPY